MKKIKFNNDSTKAKELIQRLIFDEKDLNSMDIAKKELEEGKELKEEKFIEPEYSSCDNCSKFVNVKAILSYTHTRCKSCLVKNVLKSFLRGKSYGYFCFFADCNITIGLSGPVLDCGCV